MQYDSHRALKSQRFRWTTPSLEVLLVACSLLLIIALTLYPFTFNEPENILSLPIFFKGIGEGGLPGLLSATFVQPFQSETYKLKHFEPIANVFLFMPLGGSLAYLIRRLGGTWTATFLLVALIGPVFSLTIETIQVFLPSRTSAIADIITNSMGALLGLACVFLGRYGLS
jgi:VanZ family protein